MREIKRTLRKELIQRRREMSADAKTAADESIFVKLIPLLNEASAVLTYVSTEIEVDTHRILQYCFDNGIRIAVPVSGDTELEFYSISDFDDLAIGRYNILEPVHRGKPFYGDDRALCIVPALCADGNGLRLGYGKGYYDRFLSSFHGKSIIICYSDFKQEVPAEPHDKKADMTIFDSTD